MKKRPEAEEAVRFYAELQERMSVAACSELFRGAVVLDSQNVTFEGTVTQLAQASLLKVSGSGDPWWAAGPPIPSIWAHSRAAPRAAPISGDERHPQLGLLRIPRRRLWKLGERGLHLRRRPFLGVARGGVDGGNIVDFNATGLSNGLHVETVTLDPFSAFPTLTNDPLAQITLTIDATVTGGTPTVPERSTWAMIAIGFAGLGFAGYRKARRTGVAA